MIKARSFATLSCAGAVYAASAVGCNEGGPVSDDDVSRTYQELATQLQNCGSNALDCLGAANCDDAAEAQCRDAFKSCREETRAAYRAFRGAVRECWAAKRECVADAGRDDAGAEVRQACREQLRACIADNRPIPPPAGPCMQGLRECVQADVAAGEHPSREQVRDCMSEAHRCVLDRIPMCGPEDGGRPRSDGGRPHFDGGRPSFDGGQPQPQFDSGAGAAGGGSGRGRYDRP